MFRSISLALRRSATRKESAETLARFDQWKSEINNLPVAKPAGKKLLIIRLDDIGDYLIFRNSLAAYKNSPRWDGYEITLLGNVVWRPFYEYADAGAVDKTVWVSKNEYFDNEAYRKELWATLRTQGYAAVICPSHSRPLPIDDMLMLAAGAPLNISGENAFPDAARNIASDSLYNEIYRHPQLVHEYLYNIAFANWCCGTGLVATRPSIPVANAVSPHPSPYILCSIGASKSSRRWQAKGWIDLIKRLQQNGMHAVLAGGKTDTGLAGKIVAATGIEDITGKVSLIDMINWTAHAGAVISNDSMAAHLSVACNRPTIIIASGDNFYKFSGYKEAGITGVCTIYPHAFMQTWKKAHFQPFRHYVAVTMDIVSIRAAQVFEGLKELGF